MALKWTFALILICLPILATVITAFRVRDLPKIPQDNVRKTKCVDCDGNKDSVKDSDRNAYEELKRAVREKQQIINQKEDDKSTLKNDAGSESEEDDGGFFSFKTIFSQGPSDKVKVETSKSFWSFGNGDDNDDNEDGDDDEDDNDDDDDDEDDDDDNVISNIKKTTNLKKRESLRKAGDSKEISGWKFKSKEKGDGTDDFDHEDKHETYTKKSKILTFKKTQSVKSSEIKESVSKPVLKKHVSKKYNVGDEDDDDDDYDDDDDDDDNEDDDDGDDEKPPLQKKIQSVKKNQLKSKLEPQSSNIKLPITKPKLLFDGNDDDHNKIKLPQEATPKDAIKKVDVKPKLALKETKQVEIKSKSKAIDEDDSDHNVDVISVENDDDDSPPLKKQVKQEQTKHEVVTPHKPSADAKEIKKTSPKPEKEVKDKIVTKIGSTDTKKDSNKDTKPMDSLINKESETSNKQDKLKQSPAQKSTPAKEEKKSTKEPKIEEKHKKEIPKKDRETEKIKPSGEKDKKVTQHEELKRVEKKFSYEPKKIDDLRDGFKPYHYKDAKTEPDKKRNEDKKIEKISKEQQFDSQETLSTTDGHLKHVTDALHRRNLLKSEFEDFYAFFPTFAPNFSRIHNPECRRHGQIVLRQLRGTKLWALNMLDATAKIPSGILQGNGIQLGDFDQCLASRARVQLESGSVVKVDGQYCLVRLEVKAEHPELETPVHLAQAKNLIRSRIDDPGHFVPRFSTLSWGVCVPAACGPEDVEVIVKDAIKHYQHTSGLVFRVKVDEQECQVEKAGEWWKDWVELPTVLTLSFYGIIIMSVLLATLQDFFARRSEEQGEEADDKAECDQKKSKGEDKEATSKRSDSFLSAFSLYHTISKLMAPGDTDEISCIHGIRAIATIALLVVHKFLPVAVTPYTNRLRITEIVSTPLWSWCRAGWVFTDCFLLLSGALSAHRIVSDTNSGAPKRLFSRYLRLTPALLAVVLFYAFVWDNISSGPMWGTLITKNAQICQNGWWWNLLYVQNYFGFEDMCAPQTHQLALDMQLTILGCILVWVTQTNVGLTKFLFPVIHVIAAYSRYTTVRDHRLTMLAYHGVSVSQLYRTARLSYTSTLHRSTPYLVGLSLGVALKNTTEQNKILLGLGWLSSGALWCLVWWAGIDSGSTQYRYSASFAAQYAALAPIASALAIAWVIYAIHSGNRGFLSRFLCCRPLVMISRLSYALYLCQFIVFITNVSTIRTSSEFTLISLIDIQEISAILLISTVLTLTLVIPMQSLPKLFTFSSKPENKATRSEEKTIANDNKIEENNHVAKEERKEMPQRRHLIAHREVLEEIPEVEVEYESQRDNDHLEEILEEEEDEEVGDESQMHDDDLEIIEEEGGEMDGEESWMEREEYSPRRSYSNDDQELDEWEWTANGSSNGAQHYRYSR